MASTSDELVRVPGGTFAMGSDAHYAEEAPIRTVTVASFHIERTPVTNRSFAAFADATGYVTLAERTPDAALYPDVPSHLLRAGSAVFTPPGHAVDLAHSQSWWCFVPGANWRLPAGPDRPRCEPDHPVVHIAYEDACAYSAWKGRRLPTEAQWEYAARGGLEGRAFAWGDELRPGGRSMANTWHGRFPHERVDDFGHARTSPVGLYPPNAFGLVDMIGNVWEWTRDFYAVAPHRPIDHGCCASTPSDEDEARARTRSRPAGVAFSCRVLKGGSHLCAPNYCRRYRPAARHAHEEDTSTSHIGFRCIAEIE